jgi:hypothetical protein
MKEEIIIDGQLSTIIVSANFDEPGIHFLTSNDLSQQVASMSYSPGKVIPAHTHNPGRREVSYTQEALLIRQALLSYHVPQPSCGPAPCQLWSIASPIHRTSIPC